MFLHMPFCLKLKKTTLPLTPQEVRALCSVLDLAHEGDLLAVS